MNCDLATAAKALPVEAELIVSELIDRLNRCRNLKPDESLLLERIIAKQRCRDGVIVLTRWTAAMDRELMSCVTPSQIRDFAGKAGLTTGACSMRRIRLRKKAGEALSGQRGRKRVGM